ncbi:MAG: T9SS type A sorting domain-containing protein [Flavobacteriales bacterium]|nr:T9SS type A sorting domain-containing protein [Flavobacteriales bacterium]
MVTNLFFNKKRPPQSSSLGWLFSCLLLVMTSSFAFGQNSLNSGDFVGGSWGSGQAMSASAGSSLIITKSVSSSGDKYFRFFGDNTPCGEYHPNSNGENFNNGQTTPIGSNCGNSNNAWKVYVANATDYVVFKTDGSNAGGNGVAFVVQGNPISVSSVSQAPATPSSSQSVTVTATLSGTKLNGQDIYLRYHTGGGFSSASFIKMTGSGTTFTATIPAQTGGTTVSYYVLTSGTNTPSNTEADFRTINLNNNSGSNYSYTVSTAPATPEIKGAKIGIDFNGGGAIFRYTGAQDSCDPGSGAFDGTNLGTMPQSGTLKINGANLVTSNTSFSNAKMYYRVYKQGSPAPSFTAYSSLATQTSCGGGDKFEDLSVITIPPSSYASDGVYNIDVYHQADETGTTYYMNDGGNNYTATFTIAATTTFDGNLDPNTNSGNTFGIFESYYGLILNNINRQVTATATSDAVNYISGLPTGHGLQIGDEIRVEGATTGTYFVNKVLANGVNTAPTRAASVVPTYTSSIPSGSGNVKITLLSRTKVYNMDGANGSNNATNFDLGTVNPGASIELGTEAKVFASGGYRACGCSAWYYDYSDGVDPVATDFPLPGEGSSFGEDETKLVNGKFKLFQHYRDNFGGVGDGMQVLGFTKSGLTNGTAYVINEPNRITYNGSGLFQYSGGSNVTLAAADATTNAYGSTANTTYNTSLMDNETVNTHYSVMKFKAFDDIVPGTTKAQTSSVRANRGIVLPTCLGEFKVALAMLSWASTTGDCSNPSTFVYNRDINENKTSTGTPSGVSLNPWHPALKGSGNGNTLAGTNLFYVFKMNNSGTGGDKTYNGSWSAASGTGPGVGLVPDKSTRAIITGDLNVTAANSFECNVLTINDGVTLTIEPDAWVRVLNNPYTAGNTPPTSPAQPNSTTGTGKVVVQHGGNFVQDCANCAGPRVRLETQTRTVNDYTWVHRARPIIPAAGDSRGVNGSTAYYGDDSAPAFTATNDFGNKVFNTLTNDPTSNNVNWLAPANIDGPSANSLPQGGYYSSVSTGGTGTGVFVLDVSGWVAADDTAIEPGKGFILKTGGQRFTNIPTGPVGNTTSSNSAVRNLVYRGQANNGTIQVDLNSDGTSGIDFEVGGGNQTLLGNPYPSAIDAQKFLSEPKNQNIEQAVYYWTSPPITTNGKYPHSGGFATWNLTGGAGSAVYGFTPTQYIGVGQAFSVYSTGEGIIEFNNTQRVTTNHVTATNGFARESSASEEKDRLWIDLKDNVTGIVSNILVGYVDGSTRGYDRRYDARAVNEPYKLYTKSEGNENKLVIQGRGKFDSKDAVPVIVENAYATESNIYEVSLTKVEGVFAKGVDVLLKDKELNTIHNLTKDGDYKFVSGAKTIANRFELVYNADNLATENVIENGTLVALDGGMISVKSADEIANVEVYDITGRLIKSIKGNGTEVTESLDVAKGVYIVKTTSVNGNVDTQKVGN